MIGQVLKLSENKYSSIHPLKQFKLHVVKFYEVSKSETEVNLFKKARTHTGNANTLILVFNDSVEYFISWLLVSS